MRNLLYNIKSTIIQNLSKDMGRNHRKWFDRLTKITLFSCFLLFGSCLCSAQSEIKFTQKKDTYQLVVSFISKGSGIDHKSKDKIDLFIQKQTKKPAFEICQMGREGETTYLFHLKELTKKEKKKFVIELKGQIIDKEMVHVEEDKPFESKCRN